MPIDVTYPTRGKIPGQTVVSTDDEYAKGAPIPFSLVLEDVDGVHNVEVENFPKIELAKLIELGCCFDKGGNMLTDPDSHPSIITFSLIDKPVLELLAPVFSQLNIKLVLGTQRLAMSGHYYNEASKAAENFKSIPGFELFDQSVSDDIHARVFARCWKQFKAHGGLKAYRELTGTLLESLDRIEAQFSSADTKIKKHNPASYGLDYISKSLDCLDNFQLGGATDFRAKTALKVLIKHKEKIGELAFIDANAFYQKFGQALDSWEEWGGVPNKMENIFGLYERLKGKISETSSEAEKLFFAELFTAVFQTPPKPASAAEILNICEALYQEIQAFGSTRAKNDSAQIASLGFFQRYREQFETLYYQPLKGEFKEKLQKKYFDKIWEACEQLMESAAERGDNIEAAKARCMEVMTADSAEKDGLDNAIKIKINNYFIEDVLNSLFPLAADIFKNFKAALTNDSKTVLFEAWSQYIEDHPEVVKSIVDARKAIQAELTSRQSLLKARHAPPVLPNLDDMALHVESCPLIDDNATYAPAYAGPFVHADNKKIIRALDPADRTADVFLSDSILESRVQVLLIQRPPMLVLAALLVNKPKPELLLAQAIERIKQEIEPGISAAILAERAEGEVSKDRGVLAGHLEDDGPTGAEVRKIEQAVATQAKKLAETHIGVQKRYQQKAAFNLANHPIFDAAIAAALTPEVMIGGFEDLLKQFVGQAQENLTDNKIILNRFAVQCLHHFSLNFSTVPEPIVLMLRQAKAFSPDAGPIFLLTRLLKAIFANIGQFLADVSEPVQAMLRGAASSLGLIAMKESFRHLGIPKEEIAEATQASAAYDACLFKHINGMVSSLNINVQVGADFQGSGRKEGPNAVFVFNSEEEKHEAESNRQALSACQMFMVDADNKPVLLTGVQRFMEKTEVRSTRGKTTETTVHALLTPENKVLFNAGQVLSTNLEETVAGPLLTFLVTEEGFAASEMIIKTKLPIGFSPSPERVALVHELAIGKDNTALLNPDVTPSSNSVNAAIDAAAKNLKLVTVLQTVYRKYAKVFFAFLRNPRSISAEQAVDVWRILAYLERESISPQELRALNTPLDLIAEHVPVGANRNNVQKFTGSIGFKLHLAAGALAILLAMRLESPGKNVDTAYFVDNYSPATLDYLNEYVVPLLTGGVTVEFVIMSLLLHLSVYSAVTLVREQRQTPLEEGMLQALKGYDDNTKLSRAEHYLNVTGDHENVDLQTILRVMKTVNAHAATGPGDWRASKTSYTNLGDLYQPPFSPGERRLTRRAEWVQDVLYPLLPVGGAAAVFSAVAARNAPAIQEAAGDYVKYLMFFGALGGGGSLISPIPFMMMIMLLLLIPPTIVVYAKRAVSDFFAPAPADGMLPAVADHRTDDATVINMAHGGGGVDSLERVGEWRAFGGEDALKAVPEPADNPLLEPLIPPEGHNFGAC